LLGFLGAANFALMAAKKAPDRKEEKRVSTCISGMRRSTFNWMKERAAEADLPFSKYVSLLFDAIKEAGEEELKGGGGNRTRQLLTSWFSEAARRGTAQRKAA
jgi:hypothetical protein